MSTRREQTRSGLAMLLGPERSAQAKEPPRPPPPVKSVVVAESKQAPTHGTGELQLSSIDPDPNQPRKAFDEEALQELADSIKEYGVLQAITVRVNPDKPGRYMIKTGERRYRASKLAGLRVIPAVVDAAETHEKSLREIQMIENIHREALTPMEIAEYLREKLIEGKKKGEIAALIKKSPAFVSRHLALINLPAPLQEAFDSGRCSDLSVLYELRILHKEAPEKTTEWMARTTNELTRGLLSELRSFVRGEEQGDDASQTMPKPQPANEQKTGEKATPNASPATTVDIKRSEMFSRLLGTRVQVEPKQIRISILNPEELERVERLLTAAFAPKIAGLD
jgi:ParB family transcriptional regulator, chromosome partitioning protein